MTWSAGLSVTADGTWVVAHAGSVAVRLLADQVGLTGGLSRALTRRSLDTRSRRTGGRDPGMLAMLRVGTELQTWGAR
jgi:uncharacterized protein (AIM24 family)